MFFLNFFYFIQFRLIFNLVAVYVAPFHSFPLLFSFYFVNMLHFTILLLISRLFIIQNDSASKIFLYIVTCIYMYVEVNLGSASVGGIAKP